jgi:hypothetical protein
MSKPSQAQNRKKKSNLSRAEISGLWFNQMYECAADLSWRPVSINRSVLSASEMAPYLEVA